MSSISEIYRVRQRAIEYALKHNNNSKAAVKYKTSRQQIKRWRDRYDGTVQSLLPKSRRPKSHPNQHTQEEVELVMKKYRKFGYEGLAEVYVKARKEGYSRTYDSMCKIIRKMKGNAKEKPKKQHKRKKKVEQAKYPGERVHKFWKWQENTVWAETGGEGDRVRDNPSIFAMGEWKSGKKPQAWQQVLRRQEI